MTTIDATCGTLEAQDHVTAEHEAAHAIMYLYLGYSVESISIDDALTLQTGDSIEIWDLSRVAIAGIVIEDRYAPMPLEDRVRDEAIYRLENPDDVDASLSDLAMVLPGMESTAYRAAQNVLSRFAVDHARLTAALLQHRTLSTADIDALGLEVSR